MTYNKQKFKEDRQWGEEAEQELLHILNNNPNYKDAKKVPHGAFPYDLQVTTKGELKTIEVKRLKGGYFTGVVEVWLNTGKTRRPKWHSSDTDYIFFKDDSRNQFFVYDAQAVIKYLQSINGPFTWARANDDGGWIYKFHWQGGKPSEDHHLPGYIGTFKGMR